jgi:hypothetical protein
LTNDNFIPLLVYIYLAFIGIAFLSSLNAFRLDFPIHLKVFSILLGLDFLVEFSSTVLVNWLHVRTNVPLYNSFMLVETMTYAWFFRTILTNRALKMTCTVFMITFPIFWVVLVFFVFGGIGAWNSYVYIVESLFTVCMAAAFYYQLFTAPNLIRLTTSPEFWIATGLIIFYTCNLPYLGMLNFITKEYFTLAQRLLMLLQILNIVMYSLITLAYLCQNTKRTTNTMRSSAF